MLREAVDDLRNFGEGFLAACDLVARLCFQNVNGFFVQQRLFHFILIK